MPIFTRRRLQSMIDDLASLMDETKARDLLGKLESNRVEQALPAEMELALTWALSKLGQIDIEPSWWADQKRPDVYTESLFPGHRSIVEIASITDNSMSGVDVMTKIGQQICEISNAISRGIGDYLYFTFREESGFKDGRFYRRRLAPRDYVLSQQLRLQIAEWVKAGAFGRLVLVDEGLNVSVERSAHKQITLHNVRSSMPPETYSLTNNPLHRVLKSKLAQLAAAPSETLRVIFLADVGSTLLRRSERAQRPTR